MSKIDALRSEDRALYFPAVSETFARFAHRGSLPASLPLTASDLNFLDPASTAFFYPFALYSAGQAAPSGDIEPSPCMVTERDRSATLIIGDSGGYQIQNGVIQFNRGSTPLTILRWLERTADWSMVLDFPTGGINAGNMRPHIAALEAEGVDLEGLSGLNGFSVDYNACLEQTKINNDLFRDRRAAGTRLLNVIQGRNESESKYWFDSVKGYPFEGWALAGANRDHFSLIVRRLLDLRNDGLLTRCGWIHVLGTSSLYMGCLLTAVQRALKSTTGLEIQISFDSATPFKAAANHAVLAGHTLDQHGWSVQYLPLSSFSATDNNRLLADVLRERFDQAQPDRSRSLAHTFVSQNITLGDLRNGGDQLTTEGSYLLMHHNVEGLLGAHQHAHQVFFPEDGLPPDPLAIPLRAKTIAETIRMAFTGTVVKDKPQIADVYACIDDWRPWMDDLAS